jgi:hypothetical protein
LTTVTLRGDRKAGIVRAVLGSGGESPALSQRALVLLTKEVLYNRLITLLIDFGELIL